MMYFLNVDLCDFAMELRMLSYDPDLTRSLVLVSIECIVIIFQSVLKSVLHFLSHHIRVKRCFFDYEDSQLYMAGDNSTAIIDFICGERSALDIR